MQNAELHRARAELEISLARYAELYDFAPVGYFTFDARGRIREANLTGANLLGIERRLLLHQPFSAFILAAADKKRFHHHLKIALQRRGVERCKIHFSGEDGTVICGQLQSVAVVTPNNEDDYILTSIVDGTVQVQLENKLRHTHEQMEATVQKRTTELTLANARLTT